jgi:polysaccharide export outer membrane protein
MNLGAMMRSTIFITVVLIAGCLSSALAQRPALNPIARAYGESEFRLGPDDVVEVFVYKEQELSTTVVVRPDGKISLPLIGELSVNGKTAVELQKEIAQKLFQYIAQPTVNVIVKEVNSAKVSVLGEVKTPGMYKIKDRSTVLDAVALAGGFTEYAKRTKVTLIRIGSNGQPQQFQINVDDQLKGRVKGDLFYILPYDKIYVQ